MMYKINNSMVDIDKTSLFHQGDQRTRGSQRLYQERVTHPALFNSFIPRTLRQWNSLPPWLTAAPSLEFFQRAIGDTCRSAQLHR
eukprot:TRINITY_DN35723_c0_g1_i5.p1 TRINITY_DN35723_c0_g1~~TRINITY_DN35723_c0_g1_i5.p1  ORF type:complete len:100 (-),score=24.70 TRINITY_DN35723_c0_g1_i5:154-408(-)